MRLLSMNYLVQPCVQTRDHGTLLGLRRDLRRMGIG